MTAAVMPAPFEYTATGVLGDQRSTMLTNELHLRNELARSRKRGYVSYPGITFRYGMPNEDRAYGVAEALRWPSESRGSMVFTESNRSKSMPRDFVRLNRAALDAGLVTCRELHEFRNTNDIRMRPPAKGARTWERVRTVPPDIIFGKAIRPSSPINQILENKYQDDWLALQRKAHLARTQQQEIKVMPPGAYRENKTSQLRTCVLRADIDGRPLWHMPRFTKSATKLDTFRSQTAREHAYKHHEHESAVRHGNNGQGIY